MITVLEDDIVRLRALEPEDLEVLYLWENDSQLWDYGSTLAPYSKFALREYISESRQDIFQTRQLRLMISLKSEQKAIGTIDLYEFDPMNLRAGVGILLEEKYRGKGFGVLALQLIQQYAFDFLFLKQLYAFIPKENHASMKLFSSCGYVQTGTLYAWMKNQDSFQDVFFVQLINKKHHV